MSGRVMYVIRVRVPVRIEKDWDEWHNTEHIPKVLEQPGFISVRQFRSLTNKDNEAEYFVLYELRNQAAYNKYVQSEHASALRQEYLDVYGPKTKITRWAWQETFHLMK